MKKCPVCKSSDGVREIILGMSQGDFDESKFIVDGGLIFEGEPDFQCIQCSTHFYRGKDQYHNRFIDDGMGIRLIGKPESK